MIEQKIIQAHNTLMQIMVNGDGAIRMAEALTLLREVVDEIRRENYGNENQNDLEKG